MWEMWFIYYMHIEQVYAIYSNLHVYTGGNDNCLCINRREPGLHNPGKGPEDLGYLMTEWKEEYVIFPKDIVQIHWDGSTMGSRHYYSLTSSTCGPVYNSILVSCTMLLSLISSV